MGPNQYVISSMKSAVQNICSRCTYPIFYIDHRGRPDLVATALTVSIGGVVHLITAAHAIKDRGNNVSEFFIGTSSGIVEIEGKYTVTEANPSDGIDLYDIAVVELSENFVSKYDLNFVSEKIICPWEFLDTSFFVFVFGFPSSKNKQVKSLIKNEFNSFRYSYAGEVVKNEETFFRHNRLSEIHTCMTYGKNWSSNKPVHPKGCSGGGLWIIDENGNTYLDSIFIEYYSKTDVAFGTKLIHVLRMLSQSDNKAEG